MGWKSDMPTEAALRRHLDRVHRDILIAQAEAMLAGKPAAIPITLRAEHQAVQDRLRVL